MASRSPEDVFTPSAIVSREMFARRNEPDMSGNPGLQDGLRDALRERGRQVLIHGDTGVGKSSLLKYAAEDESMPTLVVECFSNNSYADLVENAIKKIVDVRELSRSSTRSAGAEIEGQAKFLISLKGKVKAEAGNSREFQVVEKPPIDVLLEAMQAAGRKLLVLDNFQNVANVDDRLLVAQTMEMMADRSAETENIKTVVIGIAEDAASLVGGSGSFQRRTTEIGVPRMPDEEIREILSRGFDFLDITVSSVAIEDLVFYSDGFPFFAHLLGLHVARTARTQNLAVNGPVIEAALARAAQGVDRSYAERMRLAVEAGGEVQPRTRIMRILRNSSQREWRSADVISAWEAEYQESRSDYAFLHVALAQLMSAKYGSVLKRTGPRNRYVYQFSDPHMRPFLRMTM